MNRSQGLPKLLGALLALCVAPLCAAQTGLAASADASGGHSNRWVATWSAAQQQPGPMTIDAIFGADKSRSFENQTIRHIVHTSVGGRKVRVRAERRRAVRSRRSQHRRCDRRNRAPGAQRTIPVSNRVFVEGGQ